jgi:YegS/Rv2252/BmrU family lipid kinase
VAPNASLLPLPITLIINANSRKGLIAFRSAVAAVQAAGIPLREARAVKSKAETLQLLKREVAAGTHTVIVGGGDGTLSECAGHLIHTNVAMGVLPLGTGNTFARSIGIPLDMNAAAQTIAHGNVQAIDVGRVNGQVFLNSVSLGLSCEIAGALDKRTKRRLGMFSWPIIGARVIATHHPVVLKVTSEEKSFPVRTHQLLVVNGRYVAGPIAAAPEASVQDSHFDVFVLGGAGKKALARAAWQWLRGQHTFAPETRYFKTTKLRVESTRRSLPANVDGDINENTPLEMEVLPGALRVVVPQGFRAEEA